MSLPLKISRLEDYNKNRQQAGLWNRMIWQYNGPELFFIRAELDFNDEIYNEEGWLLEFEASFYHEFMGRYKEDVNNRLFTTKASEPINFQISDKLCHEISDLARLLKEAIDQHKSMLYLQTYIDLILLNINRYYASLSVPLILSDL